ncbi:unnamed protein product [Ostreobium quekettii]|uniref:Uncharacterized protein n=1 Tax=Ostreobium quekettii TaxID=121088 RepID=A0A8S1IL84_9CHLO|nr:unnamed protein product [Ostreobium quekettii]
MGHDVVEYHRLHESGLDAAPGRIGDPRLACRLRSRGGAREAAAGAFEFWFASEGNLGRFRDDPWKYAPRLGGFGAWGVARGSGPGWPWGEWRRGPPSQPWDSWTVHNGSLYLHFCPGLRDLWLTDVDENIRMAEKRWQEWWGSLNAGPFNLECFDVTCLQGLQGQQNPGAIQQSEPNSPELECTTDGFASSSGTSMRSTDGMTDLGSNGKEVEAGDAVDVKGIEVLKGSQSSGWAAADMHRYTQSNPQDISFSSSARLLKSVGGGGRPQTVVSPPQQAQSCLTNSSVEPPMPTSTFGGIVRPVLMGYDMVEFRNLADGEEGVLGRWEHVCHLAAYNESKSLQGRQLIGVYEFWFANEANMKAFGADPWKFAPMWGGFCSWGVANERRPSWPWASYHLGPPANPWNAWTIYNGTLYFDYWPSIARKFFGNATRNLERAESRWREWFGGLRAGPFNTDCFTPLCLDWPQGPPPCPPGAECGDSGDVPEVRCFTRSRTSEHTESMQRLSAVGGTAL